MTVPVLSKHRHKKKPKLTSDVHRTQELVYVTEFKDICDAGDIRKPLLYNTFGSMSDSVRISFVRVNYPTIVQDYMYKIVHDYRLFAYLFDNCSMDTVVRNNMSEVVMDDIDLREERK